jgi:hypothetical protein
MVSKVGTGPSAHLICSDCGLTRAQGVKGVRASPLGQLISCLLMASFVVTAVGLMAIKDQQSPSLLDEQGMPLNETREGLDKARRRWIVVPGTPGSSLNR